MFIYGVKVPAAHDVYEGTERTNRNAFGAAYAGRLTGPFDGWRSGGGYWVCWDHAGPALRPTSIQGVAALPGNTR